MKNQKWKKVAITVVITLLAAIIGVYFGIAMDNAYFFGPAGDQMNLLELMGVVCAIAAAGGCITYFNDKNE